MLATWKDLVFLSGYLVTAVVPRRLDRWIAEKLASLYVKMNPGQVRRLTEEIRGRMGPLINGSEAGRLAGQRFQVLLEDRWGQVRAMHPRAWEPEIALDGLEHIQEGLAHGRGVILWGMSLGGALVAKQGLWRAGVRFVHLLSERHALPSGSVLAWKLVRPLRWRSEAPYMAGRVVIPADGSLGYLRTLGERLAGNACVSIRGEHRGRQNVEAPLLGLPVSFATGAPSLAWRHDSVLLTVYAVRVGPSRHRVVIENPIEADRSLDRKKFAAAAVREFAARLERHIVEHPAAWDGWRHGRL